MQRWVSSHIRKTWTRGKCAGNRKSVAADHQKNSCGIFFTGFRSLIQHGLIGHRQFVSVFFFDWKSICESGSVSANKCFFKLSYGHLMMKMDLGKYHLHLPTAMPSISFRLFKAVRFLPREDNVPVVWIVKVQLLVLRL